MTEYERQFLRLISDLARLARLDALFGQAPWATSGWAEVALRLQQDPNAAANSIATLLDCSRAPAM